MLQTVSKGIAGALAAGVGVTATFIVVPPEVQMPWWGYVLVGIANAGLGFAVVYLAPKNRD